MNETDKAFRLVVKPEIRRQGELFEAKRAPYFYHAVATNLLEKEKNTEEVLEWHNERVQKISLTLDMKSLLLLN